MAIEPHQSSSITVATPPRPSAHLSTSSKSPDRTTPEKLVVVVDPWHWPQWTFASSSFFMARGMEAQNYAAGAVKLGRDSTVILRYLLSYAHNPPTAVPDSHSA